MALGALTLSVTSGVQGRPFQATINGLTTGRVEVLGDGSPGFSTVNGKVMSNGLPYPVSTVALREYDPGVGSGFRDSRIDITAATSASLRAQAIASLDPGRSLVRYRTAGTRQADGTIVYTLIVEDDLGASRPFDPTGSTPTPTPTPTPTAPVTNNTVVPNSVLTTGQAEQSTIHTARVSGGQKDIQLAFPGYWVNPSNFFIETPYSSAYTFEAAVEYPVGSGSWTRVLTSGALIGTAAPGAVNTYTDLTALPTIPNGSDYRLWVRMVGAELPNFTVSGSGKALYTDEGRNTVAGSTSVPKAVTDNSTRAGRTGPIGIFGTTADDTISIVGDSQQAFANNVLNFEVPADHNRGDIANTLGGAFAYTNLGVGGMSTSVLFWNAAAGRTGLIQLARKASIVIDELGINEYYNRNNDFQTSLATKRRSLPLWNGRKYIPTNVTPSTSGPWTLVDGSDQGVFTTALIPTNYNANFVSVVGVTPLDRSAPMTNPNRASAWAATGTAQGYTVDGIHMSAYAAYTIMPAQKATWLSQIGSLSAAAFTQSSIALAGTLSFSGGYATNGTTAIDGAIFPGLNTTTLVFRMLMPAAPGSAFAMINNSGASLQGVTITTSGTILLAAPGGGNTATGTKVVTDGAEHEVAIVISPTKYEMYVDGVLDATITYSLPVSVKQVFKFSAGSTFKVREMTLWNVAKFTGTYTPALFSGTEEGLVARWPLATNGSGILGPVLPQ